MRLGGISYKPGNSLGPARRRSRLVAGGSPLARPEAIGRIVHSRETPAETTETAYYLLSSALSPNRLNEVVRSHWMSRTGRIGASMS